MQFAGYVRGTSKDTCVHTQELVSDISRTPIPPLFKVEGSRGKNQTSGHHFNSELRGTGLQQNCGRKLRLILGRVVRKRRTNLLDMGWRLPAVTFMQGTASAVT